MTIKPFVYADAATVADAVQALSPTCRPYAGGTDLLGLMKADLAAPEQLVNVKTIAGLDGFRSTRSGLQIGATVTLTSLLAERALEGHAEWACLSEALLQTASPQLRHMATIGGNLLQKPRCWYYRNPLTYCWRKGGQMCFAYRGENKYHVILSGGPCYAVHPSDPAVALLALDAGVVIEGPAGERTLTLREFYKKPDRTSRLDTVLAVNELVTSVLVPEPAPRSRGAYIKVADRAAWDFALVSAAVQVSLTRGKVQQARIALGGVANIPWRALEAEQALQDGALNEAAIEAAAIAAAQGARPLEHNGYKVPLVQEAVRQALRKVAAA